MGQTCVGALRGASDLELVSTSGRNDDLAAVLRRSSPDVVVEFTVPQAVEANLRTIAAAGCHAVSGTTGLLPAALRDLGALFAARARGLVVAANFSIGVVLLQRFAREAVRWFSDVELIELHHEQKLDAPSGTALTIARQLAGAARGPLNGGRPIEHCSLPGARGGVEAGIPIHAVRLPGLLAHQQVLFGGVGQLLTLKHDASDRRAYMPGVLLAVRSVRAHRGLVDGLEPLLA